MRRHKGIGNPKGNTEIKNTNDALPIDDKSDADDHEKVFSELVVVGGSHFTISALIDGDTRAVVYNMLHRDESDICILGQLVVRSKTYSFSHLGPHAFKVRFNSYESTYRVARTVPLRKPMKISELTKFVEDRNMGDYVFDFDGKGCRYWVLTLLEELGKHGFVDVSAARDAEAIIEQTEGPTMKGLFRNFEEI